MAAIVLHYMLKREVCSAFRKNKFTFGFRNLVFNNNYNNINRPTLLIRRDFSSFIFKVRSYARLKFGQQRCFSNLFYQNLRFPKKIMRYPSILNMVIGLSSGWFISTSCANNTNNRSEFGEILLRLMRRTHFFAQCQSVDLRKYEDDLSNLMMKTDLDSTGNQIVETVRLCLRATSLLCIFLPLMMIYPVTWLNLDYFSVWLKLLYRAVEVSGASFVKLGQWASTRRDLFSPEFCNCFSGLHHRVRPHAWRHTEQTLREAYGPDWRKLFSLDQTQEPIGSGCIAQVYKGFIKRDAFSLLIGDKVEKDKAIFSEGIEKNKAEAQTSTLKNGENFTEDQGLTVAIKVLHPQIRETFQRDLKLMQLSAKVLTFLFPKLHWVNLVQCVEEFSVTLNKQLDMFHEARCLQKFGDNFADTPEIGVPKPLISLVRKNVLVETFEEGISIGDIVRDLRQSSEVKEDLANIGVNVILKMVFVHNFVHADLHPGNLLVQNLENYKPEKRSAVQVDAMDMMLVDSRPSEEPRVRLVLLDCGITTSLSPEDRDKFLQVFTAVVKGNGEAVADLFLSKSAVNECTDIECFRREMSQIVQKGRQNLTSLSKIKVAELMQEVFLALSTHKIQFESSFASVILAIAMIEGLGRSLDPNLDLLERARPVLLEVAL